VQPVQTQSPGPAQGLQAQQLGQTARVVGQVGAATAKLGTALVKDANDAMSKQQATLHARDLDSLLGEYTRLQSYDAYEGREQFEKEAAKLREKYAKSLANQDQMTMFDTMVDAQMSQAMGRARQHHSKQTRLWNIEITQVNMNRFAQEYSEAAASDDEELEFFDMGEGSQQPTTANVGREDRMGVARAAMETEFGKLQQLAGLDAATAKAHKETAVQDLHNATFGMLMDQDPRKAQRYLEQHKKEFDPARAAAAGEKLKREFFNAETLATVRALMADVGDDPAVQQEALTALINDETDPDKAARYAQYGNAELARSQEAYTKQANEVVATAEAWFFDPANAGKNYDEAPVSLRNSVERFGVQEEIQEIVGERARRTAVSQFAAVYQDPRPLVGMPEHELLRRYNRYLSTDDMQVLKALWKEVNADPSRGPAPKFVTIQKAASLALSKYGFTEQALKDDPALVARRDAFLLDMQRRADRDELDGMGPSQLHDFMSDLLASQTTFEDTSWFGGLFGAEYEEGTPLALLTDEQFTSGSHKIAFLDREGRTQYVSVNEIMPGRDKSERGAYNLLHTYATQTIQDTNKVAIAPLLKVARTNLAKAYGESDSAGVEAATLQIIELQRQQERTATMQDVAALFHLLGRTNDPNLIAKRWSQYTSGVAPKGFKAEPHRPLGSDDVGFILREISNVRIGGGGV
jgi:hypothetical protein